MSLVNIPLCIFRAGQFLLKTMQTEAVMYTLTQYSAGLFLTIYDKQRLNSGFPDCDCSSESGGTGSDDQNINIPNRHNQHLFSGKILRFRTV